jgi:hypothetical protein
MKKMTVVEELSDIEKFLSKLNPLPHMIKLVNIIEGDFNSKMRMLEVMFAKLTNSNTTDTLDTLPSDTDTE